METYYQLLSFMSIRAAGHSISPVLLVSLGVIVIAGIGTAAYHAGQAVQPSPITTPSASPKATNTFPTATPKATPQPTADPYAGWKTYSDTAAKYSFRYPATVTFYSKIADGNGPMNFYKSSGLALYLNQHLVSSLASESGNDPESGHGYGRQTAEKDRLELTQGQRGEGIGFDQSADTSQDIYKVGDVYVKKTVMLLMHDTCNPMFGYDLIFYRNGYQTILTLDAAIPEIEKSMPAFFNATECKPELTFNLPPFGADGKPTHTANDMEAFLTTLAAHKGAAAAQAWSDTFTKIADSLSLQ